MKLILHQTVERLRHFAMLLVLILCAAGNANALTSDEINAAILSSESTITPTWEANDWRLSDAGTTILTPTYTGRTLTGKLTVTFSSQYPIHFNIRQRFYKYSSYASTFRIIIDEEEYTIEGSDSYSHFIKTLDAGEHKVDFLYDFKTSSEWVGLSSLKLIAIKQFETSCLKEDSMPLTFVNDPDNPWLTCDGFVQSTDYAQSNTSSKFSTTFTIDAHSLFSFDYIQGYQYSSSDYERLSLTVIIDGYQILKSNSTSWKTKDVVLPPGTHTVEFIESHTISGTNRWVNIRNICLSQNWLEVQLSQPGNLGENLLQSLGNGYLQDAKMLKIKGSLNSDDWDVISKLVNITGVDFTETDITSVPANTFSGRTNLSSVILPNTVTEIGTQAFQETGFYGMTIPNSVQKIGARAWYKSSIKFINFEENSNLTHLGYAAFYESDLVEFDMPDSVTHFSRSNYENTYYNSNTNYSYGWNLFLRCYNLKKLHLSDGLAVVPKSTVYDCTSLEEVNIPKNAKVIEEAAFYNTKALKSIEMSESLNSIYREAFYMSGLESITIPQKVSYMESFVFRDCTKLKNIVLNSYCEDMDYTFYNCTALESIVLPCATPPTIKNNPFYNVTRSKVKLIVPDFALISYGIDDFWRNFTNREAGDEASIRDYWAIVGDLTLSNEKKMQGTPSININAGGSLTLDTDMTQSFNNFQYNTREDRPGSFLSKSSSITANSLKTYFYVGTADKWFFFSPVCDVNMSDVTYSSTDSWVIRYYDGERRGIQNTNSGNWKNVPSDGVLRRGQGYIIQANATGWLNMPVTKENQNIFFDQKELTMSLANNPSENEVNAGWNFVSNPYPCYYDVYYMNMQAPITVWTGSTYRAYALNEGDNNDDTYVLRPMQPFFVQKASTDLTATMPLVGRQVNTTINHTRAPKPNTTEANPLRNLLNLELLKYGCDEAEDYTRIVINEQASIGYERTCDASKFMSMDATVAQFFSIGENDTPMAINERPYDNGNVALGVYFPEAGETFTITATRSDRKAWIYDAETGIEQDLTEGDYTFMVNKTGYDYNRFSIRFSPVTNAVEKTENVKTKVNAGAGYISVVASEDANVSVYGTDGRVVASSIGSNSFTVPAGVYVIRVDGQTFKTIVK